MRGLSTSGSVTTFSGSTGLLQALLDWLAGPAVGLGWTVKYKRNTRDNDRSNPSEPFGAACQECILHNTGLTATENILVGIREWYYVSQGANGWDLNGYTTYLADQFWNITEDQHGRTFYDADWNHYKWLPMMPLIDDTMYYWFFADEQRIIVVTKVQSNYESCYLGFGDRYGNPTDYPYPLIIKGTLAENYTYSNVLGNHCSIVDDFQRQYGSYNSLVVKPDNAWVLRDVALGLKIHPMRDWADLGIISETPSHKEVLVSPVTLIDQASNAVLMEMDQVIHIAGAGVQSEDLIDGPNKLRYRIFQNVFRTNYNDFFGVATSDYTTTTTTTTTTA